MCGSSYWLCAWKCILIILMIATSVRYYICYIYNLPTEILISFLIDNETEASEN